MFRIEFMQRALKLAKLGIGHVSPNPAVGCVIVKNGRIIGEGYHRQFAGPHAEVNAIRNSIEPVADSDVYVTLEPCSHYGKTPPCSNLLIEQGIKRVFIAMEDPNPLVNGRGIKKLKEAGIEVSVGHMEEEARELNRFFIHFVTTGRPHIILKAAITLDGFVADEKGNSKWISNTDSRREVHRLRSQVDAVLVGAGTVRKDKPELTVRMLKGRNPRKIILCKSGNLSPNLAVFTEKTILVTGKDAVPVIKKRQFSKMGVSLMEHSGPELASLLKSFATMGLASILVEGGAKVFGSFVEQGLVDEFLIYVAPVILGNGKRLFEMPPRTMKKAIRLSGQDIRICLRG